MRTILFVIILMMILYVFPVSAKGEDSPISWDEISANQAVDETTESTVLARLFQTPLHFVANHGQFPEEVVYYAKSEGATVYCTDQGLVFGFAEGSISLKFSASECENSVFAKRVKPEARGELKGKVNHSGFRNWKGGNGSPRHRSQTHCQRCGGGGLVWIFCLH